MTNLDKTTRFTNTSEKTDGQVVTIFDAALQPQTIDLSSFGKNVITFGRDDTPGANDIILHSPLVSRRHGSFVYREGHWNIEDAGSLNGLIYNNANIKSKEIGAEDFIRIDDGVQTVAEGVLFAFSGASASHWYTYDIRNSLKITIGRNPDCDIVLPHVSVSKHHARIVREDGNFFIYDNGSTNGVIVNGARVAGRQLINEKDIINITNSKLIFTSSMISYSYCKSGIAVDASNIVIRRGKGRKSFITSNNVSLNIKPGELVAIIGGSGAGKSTILNAMCGYLKPTSGNVYINGIDLYRNFDSIKKLMGYVPQSDIVYDNLSLYDMLKFTAKLRLPKDTTRAEMEAAISRAIDTVELTEKKNSFIKALSGGQRKRASIAVELLSDPNLLFLDEPASGLDPGTERSLMTSLRSMANSGKTIILVTHSTLQLKLCDKIVFMGKGGNLCFCGSHDEALRFFGVSDIVDIYNMITDNAPLWRDRYAATVAGTGEPRETDKVKKEKAPKHRRKQFCVMMSRYAKLILNDRSKLIAMLLIPLTTFALMFATIGDDSPFKTYSITNTVLFILSCICFFIGMNTSIQEICKEKTILRREYMAGLSLTSYILSKISVLSVISFVQSLIISGIFVIINGENFPSSGVYFPACLELFITVFFTTLGASVTGLLVSTMIKNPDKVAPLFYVMQIVFAGVIFELPDEAVILSNITLCHWGILAFSNCFRIIECTIGKLPSLVEGTNMLEITVNDAGKRIVAKTAAYLGDGNPFGRDIPALYSEHQIFGAHDYGKNWLASIAIIILFIIVLTVLTRFALRSIKREKS